MSSAPPLERLKVTTAELAGMLAGAGYTPNANSPLPAPGAPGPVPDDGQKLLLWTAAYPVGALRIVGPGPDRGMGITTQLLWADARGPFVIATDTVDGFDLTMLTNRSMALSWLDRALSLTTLPSPPATDRLDLDLAGYAALLALADAVTDVRLREQLDRRQRRLGGLSIDHLRAAFETGLQTIDDRWAVSGTRLVCPIDLAPAAATLDTGLARLAALGLTTGEPSSIGISQQGAPFVSSLACEPRTTGLATAVAAGDGIDVSHITLHRSAIAVHVGVWKALDAQAWLTLSQPSAAGFLELVDGLIAGR